MHKASHKSLLRLLFAGLTKKKEGPSPPTCPNPPETQRITGPLPSLTTNKTIDFTPTATSSVAPQQHHRQPSAHSFAAPLLQTCDTTVRRNLHHRRPSELLGPPFVVVHRNRPSPPQLTALANLQAPDTLPSPTSRPATVVTPARIAGQLLFVEEAVKEKKESVGIDFGEDKRCLAIGFSYSIYIPILI